MTGALLKSARQSPCERFECANARRCKAESMACSAFVNFIHHGRSLSPTEPSAERFAQAFGATKEPT